jgi:diketogulonate reductase-like aldo/keto reductase
MSLELTLNTGAKMPLLGLGVYDMHGDEAVQAVGHALRTGYRLIDTASMYGNEEQVGIGVRNSGIPREDIFVTTKVNNTQHGYDESLRAFDESMKKLDIGHIDLYLVHWPIPGKRKDTWKALERLFEEKQVRAIGVANYLIPFLGELSAYANVVPALDQVEFSPWLYRKDLHAYTAERGIALQAYTPLARGRKFNDPRLLELRKKYGRTEAQIILRWMLQLGISAIPKSSNPRRIEENFDVFGFSLAHEDMEVMGSMNEDFRVVDDPMVYL